MLDCISIGIDPELNSGSFSIFPNPVADEIYLLYDETALQDLRVEIYDIQGKSIYKSAYKNSIDLSSLQAGRYVILISTATMQWSEVLLKIK